MKKIKKKSFKRKIKPAWLGKWRIILALGILLLIVLLLLPKFRLIGFLSPQGTINPSFLSGEFDPTKKEACFNNQQIGVPPPLAQEKTYPVLGETNDQKRIEVDLTNQRIYAYEDDRKIYDFPVSSGLWSRTPTGYFRIWIKLRYSLMTGGSKALSTYYYLPNVPYTMYFYNNEIPQTRGYGIHGTYWHNNFGHPMSHGCINMKTEDVEQLYYWVNPDLQGKSSITATSDNPGTLISIYGTAPLE